MKRDPADDEAEIRELIEKQLQAYNRGDAAGFLACIAEDRVAMNPDQPLSVGRGDEKDLQEFFDTVEQSTELTIDELVVNGDWAYERGRGVGTLSPKIAADILDPAASYSYKYIRIWQRRGGQWKVTRSIWNSNQQGLARPRPQEVK